MPLPPVIAAAIQAGDTVIASSARAARAVRRLHGEAQRKQGVAAWQAPDILDWDSWLNRLWQKRLRSGSETRLLLTALQEQQVWVRLVRPRIEGRRLISVPGVAQLAQQAYALVCTYGALDFLRGERLGGPDVESFREWARDFVRLCHKEEWLSRSMLPLELRAAVLDGQVETTRLVLTGFDRTTPAQQHLIEALREQGHEVEMAEAGEVPAAETALLVEAVDKRDEIATCARWVQRQLASGTAAIPRIAVVVPNVSKVRPEIEEIFRRILAPETVTIGTRDLPLPFEFSLGVPLASIPVARAALLLLRWMHAALAQDDVSWLMLSGFLCEHEDELLLIAAFDARLRRQAMRQPEMELDTFVQLLSESWREAIPLHNLRKSLRAGRNLLPQGGFLSFAEWVDLAERVLETVRWPGAHSLQSEDFQVQARWSQLLDSVATLSFDGRKVDYAEFLEAIQRHAGQMIFAPESRDAPVQILGPLEAAGLTFDALWFLGADDASWPAPARPHAFLTRSLQRKHRMPHGDSTVDWELAQQVTLRLERTTAKCVFSYPSQNAEGICRPSTLVTSDTPKMNAKALRKLIGVRDGTAEDDFPILITDEEQAAVIPWPVEQEAGGSEILKMQAACPFQCFATRRLAARPMDETDWGLEPRERGTAVHRILQGLWEELKSRDGLVTARKENRLPGMIEQQVKAALQSYGKQIDAGKQGWSRAYLDAEEERISALIDEWLAYEEGRAPFTFEAGEMKLPALVGLLKLQVRVDRIDGVRGGRVIIDYKTGKVKKDAWEGARPDEPQLLLYAEQVEELQGLLLGQVRAGEVKFSGRVEHGNAVMPGNTKLSKPPLSAKMLQQWHKLLLDVGQQFLNGEAQVDPKQYPKTCEYCKLPGLCRIAESDRANIGEDADDADD
jgi:ATP-dependent helicase/nuclease subunit B